MTDNAEKSLNVDLSAKSRLLPYSSAADLLGLNDLYLQERDACENYRMIFTVNPICTNILYNAVTEPVFLEGSLSAVSLVESAISRDDEFVFPEGTLNQSANTEEQRIVDQIAAVRDTEYTSDRIGNFVYHCGYDIFNNHILRSNEFEHVSMERKKENKIQFNTIFDYAIDYSGKTVERVIGESDGPLTAGIPRTKIRMYAIDTIKTINTAFYDGLRTVDGWYGFYNTGYINIPNANLNKKDISLNRVLNNEPRCGFIDFYPDRSLYSFIPKVNRHRKRLERNWDCSIVYPYLSDYDMFNRVMLGLTEEEWGGVSESQKPNAVRVSYQKVVYNNVGDEMVEAHSLLRHTLNPGDEIRVFYGEKDDSTVGFGELKRFSIPVRVVSVGDSEGNNADRCFTFKFFDIAMFSEVFTDEYGAKSIIARRDDTGATPHELIFFYRKIENGCDDRYYFRKFKELDYYEYVSINMDSKTEEEAAKIKREAAVFKREPSYIDENSPKYIRLGDEYIEKVTRPLTYTQNKIAYATNIYGDRVAQVIFNDDICITGLKDNLGRPLSSVYFMVEKTNRGNKEWYEMGNTSADTVEYSHCFGDVTSGLDLPFDHETADYNVRKLHNVFSADCVDKTYISGLSIAIEDIPGGKYSGTPMPIESAITISDYTEFYGDIIEFNRANFIETTIEKVYHRFNTAQRECLKNKKYFDINYDELVGDLYDVSEINPEDV